MKLRCNKILITGGGSGIGKAIAKRLIDGGASVVISGRNANKLEEAKAEINSEKLYTLVFDVSDFSSQIENIEKAASLMGGLDGLVNNAAVGSTQVTGRDYDPWDITPDEWDTLMNINLKGAFFMMRNAVDYMVCNGVKGNILNIASNAAYTDISGAYGASKLDIVKYTHTFGKRYGHNGIIINGIAPGATFTDMISRYAHELNQKYERHAIERFIRPEEIAELAAYLMSDFGEIICGHTVVADGGDSCAHQ